MRLTFRGGIHPLHRQGEGKNLTASVPIRRMDVPKIVRIPLRQDISVPAVPTVEPGDRVLMGQCLGTGNSFLSVPIHSSVSGTVKAIEEIPSANGKRESAIIIENDFLDETDYSEPLNFETMEPQDIIQAIKMGGVLGMGGAGFSTHVKLSVPPQKGVDVLIINGAECEPFLTADQRLMTEHADRVILGTRIMMRALNVKRAIVGIEDNKPDAIAAMQKAAEGSRHVRVMALETKYPQGYEKTLIYALTGRVVPAGGLPMDAKVVVCNAASAAAVADVFTLGKPSIERVVTVTGAVGNPSNLIIRVGTSMEEAIEAAGGIVGVPLKIISGGPMMGRIVPTTQCVVGKNTSGILVLDKKYTHKEKETPCIRCGKCVIGCPMNLSPVLLMDATEADDFDAAEGLHAMDCMSCGSCSYICPAHRPLAQSIAFAKDKIRAARILAAKEREAAEKKEQQAAEEKKAAAAAIDAVQPETPPEKAAMDIDAMAEAEEEELEEALKEAEETAIEEDASAESASASEVARVVAEEEAELDAEKAMAEAAEIRKQALARPPADPVPKPAETQEAVEAAEAAVEPEDAEKEPADERSRSEADKKASEAMEEAARIRKQATAKKPRPADAPLTAPAHHDFDRKLVDVKSAAQRGAQAAEQAAHAQPAVLGETIEVDLVEEVPATGAEQAAATPAMQEASAPSEEKAASEAAKASAKPEKAPSGDAQRVEQGESRPQKAAADSQGRPAGSGAPKGQGGHGRRRGRRNRGKKNASGQPPKPGQSTPSGQQGNQKTAAKEKKDA